MATLVERLQAEIDRANSTTQKTDTTVHNAVSSLIEGFGAEKPLYSFGLLSDLHIQYATGIDNPLTDEPEDGDFRRALTYLRDKVPFTCVSGDLLSYATEEYFAKYKSIRDTYRGDMEVYESGGNHETYPDLGVSGVLDETLWRTYTGKEPYYSFAYENDVFIFISPKNAKINDLFLEGSFEWLSNILEENKNKRCFVFWHYPALGDKTGDPYGVYDNSMKGTAGAKFVELMSHYKNVIHFHGHTHLSITDEHPTVANEYAIGYRSVHIPSLVSLRFYDKENNVLRDYYYDENGNKIWGSSHSEGYICDVYDSKIVLRGISFAEGENKDEVKEMNEVFTLDTPMYVIPTVTGIEATFTQGEYVIYPSSLLNSLKSMLVVKTIDDLGDKVIVSDYTLSGTLEVGESIVTVTYGEFTTTFTVNVSAEEPGAINWLKRSVASDNTPYNGGVGYKDNYRLTSSGSESTNAGTDVTGFIPVAVGDVVRFSGCNLNSSSEYHRVAFYTIEKTRIGYQTVHGDGFTTDAWSSVYDDIELIQFTIPSNVKTSSGAILDLTNVGFIRVCSADMTEDSIITINEEITQ